MWTYAGTRSIGSLGSPLRHLIALLGVSALSGDLTFHREPLTYLMFLQNYDPDLWQGFLGVSWILVLEVMFYRTLPVLAIVVARSPRRLAIIASASFLGPIAFWDFAPYGDPRQ
jgi:peptidoglycan/LPS O-acetylase OafA/YrhL